MIIVANYKMNLTLKDYKVILKKLKEAKTDTELVLCPPFVYVPFFAKSKAGFKLGAQDVSANKLNKCTGQVNASMLKDFDVDYVIVGHSERRSFEIEEEISCKVKQAVDVGIVPIICVGENAKNESDEIILQQVKSALSKIDKQSAVVVAYEPVWSVGTGETPTVSYVNKKLAIIKKTIKKLGFECPILYGGSVDEENVLQFKKCSVDGFLVGALSLKTDRFNELLRRV